MNAAPSRRPSKTQRARKQQKQRDWLAQLRESIEVPATALDVMERAIERGGITDAADYLARIIRFQEIGEWTITRVETEDG